LRPRPFKAIRYLPLAFYDSSFLDRVRSASDIVDIISGRLPLKRMGANFVALCPFHNEKSPSFNVNPGKQIFHCFGCQTGGDVFKFVQLYENISFPEAVTRLAERAQIPMPESDSPGAQQSKHLKDRLLQLHEAITARWQHCLAHEPAGQVARDYLHKRGVHPDAVTLFRIGAAPDAWDDTVNWAKAKGFEPALVEQAGLIIKRDNGGHYDRFRGRLMFPICDEQGRVIAFSGRVLQGDEKTAKYVNSPETPLFTKGRVLFGLDKAKRAILDAGHAIICEGQLDTIACHAAGIRNVVAPQGTALTSDHARILKRYVNEVILCFDGDSAGTKAAVRSLDDLLAAEIAIRVARIPPPDDPDSLIRSQGADAFRSILSRAEGFFDFYLRHLCATQDSKTDAGRITIVRSMAEAVHKTANAVLIDTYAQKTSQRLGVSVDAVRKEFSKKSSPGVIPQTSQKPDPDTGEIPQSLPPSDERWLLKYILESSNAAHFAADHLDPDWITHPTIRRILAIYFSIAPTAPTLLAQFEGDRFAERLITEAATDGRKIDDPCLGAKDTILRLRNRFIDKQIAVLTARINDPSITDKERFAIPPEQERLRASRKDPLKSFGDSPPPPDPFVPEPDGQFPESG